MTAYEMRLRVGQLGAERLDAVDEGLAGNAAYMGDIERELAAARDTYVGLAVTEIASLRRALSGPQVG